MSGDVPVVNPDFFADGKLMLKGGAHSRDGIGQAIGELRGFANALRRGGAGLTAAQLDFVLDIAILHLREHQDQTAWLTMSELTPDESNG